MQGVAIIMKNTELRRSNIVLPETDLRNKKTINFICLFYICSTDETFYAKKRIKGFASSTTPNSTRHTLEIKDIEEAAISLVQQKGKKRSARQVKFNKQVEF
jgi:hypothetical protein